MPIVPDWLKTTLEILGILTPWVSVAASALVAGLRAAYPEPQEQLSRGLRFVEAVLDRIAMNSGRRKL